MELNTNAAKVVMKITTNDDVDFKTLIAELQPHLSTLIFIFFKLSFQQPSKSHSGCMQIKWISRG
jgi:uncharacterized membrane protein YciS (DUF1049 family)